MCFNSSTIQRCSVAFLDHSKMSETYSLSLFSIAQASCRAAVMKWQYLKGAGLWKSPLI